MAFEKEFELTLVLDREARIGLGHGLGQGRDVGTRTNLVYQRHSEFGVIELDQRLGLQENYIRKSEKNNIAFLLTDLICQRIIVCRIIGVIRNFRPVD